MSAFPCQRFRVVLKETTTLVIEVDAESTEEAKQIAFDEWFEHGEEPFIVCESAIDSTIANEVGTQ